MKMPTTATGVALLILGSHFIAATSVRAASIEPVPARCQIDRDGRTVFRGACTFNRYSGLRGTGTFSIERRNSQGVLYARIRSLFIGVIRGGVANVRATTDDYRNIRWGRAYRSRRNSACWVGKSFRICAWASRRKPQRPTNQIAGDDDPANSRFYRHLYHQKMERPYSTDWYGRLLQEPRPGMIFVRVQAVGKMAYDGILQMNCTSGLHAWRQVVNRGRNHYAPGRARQIRRAVQRIFCR